MNSQLKKGWRTPALLLLLSRLIDSGDTFTSMGKRGIALDRIPSLDMLK